MKIRVRDNKYDNADVRQFKNRDFIAEATVFLVILLQLTSVDMFLTPRVALEVLSDTGGGNIVRQGIYLVIMMWCLFLCVRKNSINVISSILPVPLGALFLWSFLSLIWSDVPEIALRRLVLTFVSAVTVLSCCTLISSERIIKLLSSAIMLLSIVSLLSVLIIPGLTIHQIDDTESAIIGDWRGVFYHKNIFGIVLSAGVIINFYYLINRRDFGWKSSAASLFILVFLLIQSGSKTPLLISVYICMIVFYGSRYRVHSLKPASIKLFLFSNVVVGFLIFALTIISYNLEIELTEDLFTGRGRIWAALGQLFSERPIIGFGYQSIFQIGENTPLLRVFSEKFFLTLSHSHNVYVEQALSIGSIGLILFLISIVFMPISNTFRVISLGNNYGLLFFGLILFCALHGVMEVGLFDRDRTPWFIFLYAYGCCRSELKNYIR